MGDFKPKQILIVHESLWEALVSWGVLNNLSLDQIPDVDDEGQACFKSDEERDDFPTYCFTPTVIAQYPYLEGG